APHFSHTLFSSSAILFLIAVAALELQACRNLEQAKPVRQRVCCLATVMIHTFLRNLRILFDKRDRFAQTYRVWRISSAPPPQFPTNRRGLAHEIWVSDNLGSIFPR